MNTNAEGSYLLGLLSARHELRRLARIRTPQLREFFAKESSALWVAIGYYAGTLVGFWLTPRQDPISTFWPPNAILLAALLLSPPRRWWKLILAVLPPHLLVQLHTGVPVLTAIGWFVTNTSEALLGAFLIRRFRSPRALFDDVEGILTFLLCGVLLAPLMTSFLDAAVVVGTGWGNDYWLLWRTRSFSNMPAELTLVPAIVLFGFNGRRWLRESTFTKYLEAALLGVSVLLASTLTFGWETAPMHVAALLYVPLPVFLWASLRFGSAGLAASLSGISMISSWYTIHGRGPFASQTMVENVRSLHVLLCIIALPLMFLATVLAERRLANQVLRESRRRLVDSQEQEQRRIARWLHDDVGQELALMESELAQLRDEPGVPASARLNEVLDQLSEVSKITREVSHGLHPSYLEHLGLLEGLRKLCGDFAQAPGPIIDFTHGKVPDSVPFDLSLCLYRVTQEALRNAQKYSRARRIEVHLSAGAGQLEIQIADDGVGFVVDDQRRMGLGIASMRDRIAAAGGTIAITSAPMKGTRIRASVPLPPPASSGVS